MSSPPSFQLYETTKDTPKALRIPEILLLICDAIQNLDQNHSSNSDEKSYQSLTVLARTNKYISDAVLDLIWKEIPSLDPLIKLLPLQITRWTRPFSKAKRPVYHVSWALTSVLREEDWARFRVYAPRVRVVTNHSEPDALATPVLKQLHSIKPPIISLLPNLRNVAFTVCTTDSIVYPSLVISEALEQLSLKLASSASSSYGGRTSVSEMDHPHVQRIPLWLQHLSEHSPNLRSFELTWYKMTSRKAAALSETLAALPKLERVQLKMGGEITSAVPVLSKLTTLREVHLLAVDDFRGWRNTDPKTSKLVTAQSTTGFPNVEILGLSYASHHILRMLNLFENSPLHELHLRMGDMVPALVLPIAQSIASHFSTTLTKLRITRVDAFAGKSCISSFEPLFSIPGIEQFTISGLPTGMNITNEDLVHVGHSWPRLKHLDFCYAFEHASYPKTSNLAGLLSLVGLCEELEYLGIQVDASYIPPLKQVPVPQHRSRLKVLDVGSYSSIEDVIKVLEVLKQYSPSLRRIKAGGNGGLKSRGCVLRWRAVESILRGETTADAYEALLRAEGDEVV